VTSSPREPVRVVIVDSDPVFKTGLLSYVNRYPDLEVVKAAASASEAIMLADKFPSAIDLIVTEVRLRGACGFHICHHVNKLHLNIKTVIVTSQYTDEAIIWARHMHAHGFLRKNVEPKDIATSILSVCDGSYTWPVTALDAQLHDDKNRALTKTEEEILELLVKANMKPPEIALRLNRSEATILNHKRSIMAKLGVKDSIGLGKYEFLLDY